MWPDDRNTLVVVRAASAPMTTSTTSLLQPNVTAAFVSGLQLQSAAAALIARGLRLDLEGIGTVAIPHVLSNAALGFVGEGSPIPTLQRAITTVTLGPAKKIAGLVGLTNEIAEHSIANAEQNRPSGSAWKARLTSVTSSS